MCLFFITKSRTFLLCLPYLIVIFSLPIMDMVLVISNRVRLRLNPFLPDANHIHHRLLKKGFDHRNSVLIIYLFTLISTFSVFLLTK